MADKKDDRNGVRKAIELSLRKGPLDEPATTHKHLIRDGLIGTVAGAVLGRGAARYAAKRSKGIDPLELGGIGTAGGTAGGLVGYLGGITVGETRDRLESYADRHGRKRK